MDAGIATDDVCTSMTYKKKAQAAFDRESAQGRLFSEDFAQGCRRKTRLDSI